MGVAPSGGTKGPGGLYTSFGWYGLGLSMLPLVAGLAPQHGKLLVMPMVLLWKYGHYGHYGLEANNCMVLHWQQEHCVELHMASLPRNDEHLLPQPQFLWQYHERAMWALQT